LRELRLETGDKYLYALLNTTLYFALLNVVYAALVVDVVGSWRPEWWIDRRFPLNLIPMWFFASLSICLLIITAFFAWFYRPRNFRLRYDFLNVLLLSLTLGFIGWILMGLYLVHTYYIGDYWVVQILDNIWNSRNILSLPAYDIDRFPTLSDTIILSYLASFGLLYFANYRAVSFTFKFRRGSSKTSLNIRKPLLFILVISALIVPVIFWQIYDSQPLESIIVMDNALWIQVMCWNFKDGFYPNNASWGTWRLINGMLECNDETSKDVISVYIFPFSHGEDFILETQVMFIKGENVEAHLLTRDSYNIRCECGMVLFARQNQATVRHMMNKTDFIYQRFPINLSITYNEWYTMRFMIHNGRIKAFVNNIQIYDSNRTYPVGNYNEPHLAVNDGVARFKYVKIYELLKKE